MAWGHGYEPQERVLPSLWFCFAFQAKASIFQWYCESLHWCNTQGRGCGSARSEVCEKTGYNFVSSVTGLHHCILGFLWISLTWPDIHQSLIFLWNVSEASPDDVLIDGNVQAEKVIMCSVNMWLVQPRRPGHLRPEVPIEEELRNQRRSRDKIFERMWKAASSSNAMLSWDCEVCKALAGQNCYM